MRKSQRAKVSGGSAVEEGYLHITGKTPIRFVDKEVADMPPEEHSEFVPSPSDAIPLHHQMAGIRNSGGGDLGGGCCEITGTGMGGASPGNVTGKD